MCSFCSRIVSRVEGDHLLLLAAGFAFRVFLHHTHELVLLERMAKRAPLARMQLAHMMSGAGGADSGVTIHAVPIPLRQYHPWIADTLSYTPNAYMHAYVPLAWLSPPCLQRALRWTFSVSGEARRSLPSFLSWEQQPRFSCWREGRTTARRQLQHQQQHTHHQ